MKIDETIRQGVSRSLPEAGQIENQELRERVYDAWAMSLAETEYAKIEDIPASAVPGSPPMKNGTQADHFRAVARISLNIAKEMKDTFGLSDIDLDEVIAGSLCHDLGKPFEFSRNNQERWKSDPRIAGWPSIRHTVYGVHIALSAGLPEKIAHIAGAHSMEGEYVKRSLAGEIVHQADRAFWKILEKADLLDKKEEK